MQSAWRTFAALAPLALCGAACDVRPAVCASMSMPGPLVGAARGYRLEVYGELASCAGSDLAPGAGAPLLVRSFAVGQPLRLDVTPGRRTLRVLAFADDAATVVIGSACASADLGGGSQPCLELTLTAPLDAAVDAPSLPLPDLVTVAADQARPDGAARDLPGCFGQACPCVGDIDCRDARYPRCGPAAQCVECLPASDNCPPGRFCTAERTCAVGCKDNGGCAPPRPFCDLVQHACIQCKRDPDCQPGKSCSPSGSCVDGCNPGKPCPPGFTCCNMLCIDTRLDTQNCGGCGMSCQVGAPTCCGGQCVSPLSNLDHCGGCNLACSRVNGTPGCSGGSCNWVCGPGFAHCRNDNSGCETAITTPLDCGGCGNRCRPINATGADCKLGGCSYTCERGFADCNPGAPNLDGCETSILDALNCGGCGVQCGLANATAARCSNGGCAFTCKPGFADCRDMPPDLDGCETDLSSTANCGGCGIVCPGVINGTEACLNGRCVVGACNGPFLDCDVNPANGCEADSRSDARSCGGCGIICPAVANGSAACVGGKCTIASCRDLFRDCDGNPGNGCETDSASNSSHCGGCGMACPAVANGVAGCAASRCTVASCNGAFRDCDLNAGNGCEVNTASDIKSCGGCGIVCPAVMNGSPSCVLGKCGAAQCGGAFKDCDGNPQNGCETDTAADLKHCGVCGKVCPAVMNGTPGCIAGGCGVGTCTGTFRDCNKNAADGCEVDVSNRVSDCGGCGTACPNVANGTPACVGGACTVGTCNGSFKDCNRLLGDGCEIDTAANPASCGACGMACPGAPNGVPACAMSKCGVACSAPFKDCNGQLADGCEVNTSNDTKNCGACAMSCGAGANGTAACVAAKCSLTCGGGYLNCDANLANGCECQGAACCGNGCQPKHSNGLGQFYDDCAPLGTPGNAATYRQAMAAAARNAWPAAGTSLAGACGKGLCEARQGAQGCGVWCYSNDGNASKIAGRVFLNAMMKDNMGQFLCLCPTTGSPSWN